VTKALSAGERSLARERHLYDALLDGLAAHLLAELIEHRVIRHHHVSALTDDQVLSRDATRLKLVELLEKRLRIDDDAVSDDAGGLRVEDAARDQVEAVLRAARDHRVTGVVSALRADDHVDGIREEVDDLALAFIAPLAADQDRDAHSRAKRTGRGRSGCV